MSYRSGTNQPPNSNVTIGFNNAGTYVATATAWNRDRTVSATSTVTIVVNSVAPPPPSPAIVGEFEGPSYIPQTDQDQVNLSVRGPDPGSYNYSIVGNPSVTFDSFTGNPPTGVLQQYQRASVNLTTPHPATTLTATITRPGYNSYQSSITVQARGISGVVEFTRAGTIGQWRVPNGVTSLRITIVGGGGGGASGSESNPYWSGGGGGGSGGILQATVNVSPGDELQYQVGDGGAGTGSVGAGGRAGNPGTASNISYRNIVYAAQGGAGGGTSGGNISNGHWNGGGAGGSPGGTAGSPGGAQRGESSGRNLMPGGTGGSAFPFGFGGAGAPGVPQGGTPTDANQNGQPGTGHGAGGGGGAGGKNDSQQGQGAAGSGGLVRIEWG